MAPSRLLLRDTAIGLLLILAWIGISHALHLDERLADYYFDVSSNRFPLKSDWLYQGILHDQLKKLSVLLAVLLLGRLIYLLCRRRFAAMQTSGYLLTAMARATLAVGLIRAHSPVACPWSLSEYGGDLPLLMPWEYFQGGHGHCWPSGHAAAGFCLLALFFWLRAKGSRWAFPTLALVLLLGGIMGWAQIVRGAHFLSHVNASLLLCWTISGLLACIWWRSSRPDNP